MSSTYNCPGAGLQGQAPRRTWSLGYATLPPMTARSMSHAWLNPILSSIASALTLSDLAIPRLLYFRHINPQTKVQLIPAVEIELKIEYNSLRLQFSSQYTFLLRSVLHLASLPRLPTDIESGLFKSSPSMDLKLPSSSHRKCAPLSRLGTIYSASSKVARDAMVCMTSVASYYLTVASR